MKSRPVLWALALFMVASCHRVNHPGAPARASFADSLLATGSLALYSDSIRLYPTLSIYYFRRSELLYGMQQFRLSLADLQRASSRDPREPAYNYARGEVYLALQKPDSARMMYAQALELDHSNLQVRLRLADALYQDRSDSLAMAQLDTLLVVDPGSAEGHGLKSQVLENEGDTTGAIREMQRAVQLSPQNYDALMALGDLYTAVNNPKAVAQYHQAFLLDTTQGEPLFSTAKYYEKVHQDDRAIAAMKQCISADHYYPGAYIGLGEIYYRRSDLSDASAMYRLAAQVDPRNADAYYHLGICDEAGGNKTQALSDYKQAYALNRRLTEAKTAIDRLK